MEAVLCGTRYFGQLIPRHIQRADGDDNKTVAVTKPGEALHPALSIWSSQLVVRFERKWLISCSGLRAVGTNCITVREKSNLHRHHGLALFLMRATLGNCPLSLATKLDPAVSLATIRRAAMHIYMHAH